MTDSITRDDHCFKSRCLRFDNMTVIGHDFVALNAGKDRIYVVFALSEPYEVTGNGLMLQSLNVYVTSSYTDWPLMYGVADAIQDFCSRNCSHCNPSDSVKHALLDILVAHFVARELTGQQ